MGYKVSTLVPPPCCPGSAGCNFKCDGLDARTQSTLLHSRPTSYVLFLAYHAAAVAGSSPLTRSATVLQVCSKHWGYAQELTGCMASVADIPYVITNDGTIYSGMPDDPEPETSLQDLPIYKEHPGEHHFFKFPYSDFLEQLGLGRRQVAGRPDWALPVKETEEAQYDCFVCGKQHAVVFEKRSYQAQWRLRPLKRSCGGDCLWVGSRHSRLWCDRYCQGPCVLF
jgi:hypothetical protein